MGFDDGRNRLREPKRTALRPSDPVCGTGTGVAVGDGSARSPGDTLRYPFPVSLEDASAGPSGSATGTIRLELGRRAVASAPAAPRSSRRSSAPSPPCIPPRGVGKPRTFSSVVPKGIANQSKKSHPPPPPPYRRRHSIIDGVAKPRAHAASFDSAGTPRTAVSAMSCPPRPQSSPTCASRAPNTDVSFLSDVSPTCVSGAPIAARTSLSLQRRSGSALPRPPPPPRESATSPSKLYPPPPKELRPDYLRERCSRRRAKPEGSQRESKSNRPDGENVESEAVVPALRSRGDGSGPSHEGEAGVRQQPSDYLAESEKEIEVTVIDDHMKLFMSTPHLTSARASASNGSNGGCDDDRASSSPGEGELERRRELRLPRRARPPGLVSFGAREADAVSCLSMPRPGLVSFDAREDDAVSRLSLPRQLAGGRPGRATDAGFSPLLFSLLLADGPVAGRTVAPESASHAEGSGRESKSNGRDGKHDDDEAAAHGGYRLGDTARSPSHMIAEPSPERATAAVDAMSDLDFAFVRQSDGSWTYAVLALRSRGGDDQSEEESLFFVVDQTGGMTNVPRSEWGRRVRLPSEHSAKAGAAAARRDKPPRRASRRTPGRRRTHTEPPRAISFGAQEEDAVSCISVPRAIRASRRQEGGHAVHYC